MQSNKLLVCFGGDWFCPGLMDRLILSVGSLLERRRADITKIAMSAFAIVKTLNV
jgi:hypothetical protein